MNANAQTDMHGTEFWCSFMNNEMGRTTARLYLTSTQNAQVTIESASRNYKNVVNVQAGKLTYCDVPDSVARPKLLETKELTGIHILSDKPICVTAAYFEVHASNAFVVIPIKRVSTGEHFITAHGIPKSKNQIQLLATEDSVVFKVNLLANSNGIHKSNVPFTLTLNQGESYSMVADTGDFSGSVIDITNDKKGIVYVGDKNLALHYGGCAHRSVVTQLNSIDWSDKKFIVMPLFGQTKGYKLKCISLDSHLWVNVNGYSHFIPNKDSSIELDILKGDSVLYVTADRPFLCFQIMKGGGKNGFYKLNSGGHPGIVQVAGATHLTKESHFVSLTDTKIKDHFVSILIDKNSRDAVFLDQIKIPPQEFEVIPDDTNYYYLKMVIHEGPHILRSSHGHQVYAYGIEISNVAESYFYFAGFKYPVVKSQLTDSVIAFDCKNDRIYGRVKIELNNPYNLPVKNIVWRSDSFQIKDGSYFKDASFVPGETYHFTVYIHFEDHIDTLQEQFTFNFPEFNPVYDFIMCKDSTVFTIPNPYFTRIRWHDNSTSRSYNANKNENVYVTATDTSGYCTFSDSARVEEVQFERKIMIDTLSDCHVNNLFRIKDSSYALNDSIRLRVWNFKNDVIAYDTNFIEYHFDQPGKPVIHLDLFLEHAQKKCRMEIPFQVHWNTYTRADFGGERFCTGDTVTVVDRSFACCDSMASYSIHTDGMSISSKKKTQQFQVTFDPIVGTGFKTFYYIVTNMEGCKDTMKKEIIVMPVAEAKFTLSDSIRKCMTLARWNFEHKRDESLTGPYEVKWNFGDTATGENDEYKNYRFRQIGQHEVKLKTRTTFGCVDSNITRVEVLPDISGSMLPDTHFLCLKIPEFEFSSVSVHPLPLHYQWFINDDSISEGTTAMVRHKFNDEFKLSTLISAENAFCQPALIERWISYLENPKAAMMVSDSIICAGTELFSAQNTSLGARPVKFTIWQWDDRRDTVADLKEINLQKAGMFDLTLWVTDSAGCVDSIQQRIEVWQADSVKLHVDDSIVCQGDEIKVSALHHSNELEWLLNQQPILHQQDTYNFPAEIPGSITITSRVISLQGCFASDSLTVLVINKPRGSFIQSADTVCNRDYRLEVLQNVFSPDDEVVQYEYRRMDEILANTPDFILRQGLNTGNNAITQYIVTREGCRDTFTSDVFVVEWRKPEIMGDTVCVGEWAVLRMADSSRTGVDQWSWQSGDGAIGQGKVWHHRYLQPGNYTPILEIINDRGCKSADTLPGGVVVYPLPNADFSYSLTDLDPGVRLDLFAHGPSNNFHTWLVGALGDFTGDSIQLFFDKGFTDRVKLMAVNQYGCFDSSSVFIEVFPRTRWHIPTAFSPGRDGLNDDFGIPDPTGVSQYRLLIYNRWGELVFYSDNPQQKWDGTYKGQPAQQGVYTYLFDFTHARGTKHYFKGIIHLVR